MRAHSRVRWWWWCLLLANHGRRQAQYQSAERTCSKVPSGAVPAAWAPCGVSASVLWWTSLTCTALDYCFCLAMDSAPGDPDWHQHLGELSWLLLNFPFAVAVKCSKTTRDSRVLDHRWALTPLLYYVGAVLLHLCIVVGLQQDFRNMFLSKNAPTYYLYLGTIWFNSVEDLINYSEVRQEWAVAFC